MTLGAAAIPLFRKAEQVVDATNAMKRTKATVDNYRKFFRETRPDLPKDWPVHHNYPQKYAAINKKG